MIEVLDWQDYFQWPALACFRLKPCHIYTIWCEFDSAKMREDFGGCLVRSIISRDRDVSEKHLKPGGRFLFRLGKNMFCDATPNKIVVFASTAPEAAKRAQELAAQYGKRDPCLGGGFYLVSVNHGEVRAQKIQVRQPLVLTDEDLVLH